MAVTLFIAFLIIAVLGRVILQYRITGDHGIRPAKSTSPLIIKISSFLLLLSFLAISTMVLLDALGLFQSLYFDSKTVHFLGAALSVFGIIITVISQYQMGSSWRVSIDENERTTLITHGVYSSVRNPIYSGVIIFGIGLLLMLPSVYMLIACVAVIISIEIHVRFGEEPYLYKLHGSQFQEYIKRTGRYFPRLIN